MRRARLSWRLNSVPDPNRELVDVGLAAIRSPAAAMIEGGSPSVLMRLGWNRNSLPAGTRITVVGFQAKDGSLRASSRELRFPDGRRMDLGGSGAATLDPRK